MCRSEKDLDLKNFMSEKKFGSERFWIQKNLGPKRIFGSEKYFVPKKINVRIKIGFKTI